MRKTLTTLAILGSLSNPSLAGDVSKEGIEIIKQFEGFRSEAYKCPAGVWTIGYGTTSGVKQGDTITQEQAEKRLEDYLNQKVEPVIDDNVKVKLTQNQYDAIASLLYNVGSGAKGVKDGIIQLRSGEPSTLLKKLNTKDYDGAANEFPRWNKAAGKTLEGLTKRRAQEFKLFQKK